MASIRSAEDTNRSTVHQTTQVSMSFGWMLTRRNRARSVGGDTGGDAQWGCGPTEMVVDMFLDRNSSAEKDPTRPRKGSAERTQASGRTRSGEARAVMR